MAQDTLLITNLTLFRTIAEDAAARSLESLNDHRRPKSNGEPGHVLSPDLKRTSFKEAMIAIAFSGMYLEALIAIATKRMRKTGMRHIAKSREEGGYRGRLEALGIEDEKLLRAAKHLNDVRNNLVHEEPIELSLTMGAAAFLPHVKHFVAQDEAQKAIKLISQVTEALRPKG